jgi:Tfp pilus assembly protein PilV
MLATVCPTDPGARAAADTPACARGSAPRGAAATLRARGSRRRGGRASAARRFCRRLRSDSGFTLLELLVASLTGVIVLTATFALLESSQQVQARDAEWALALQEDRVGLARMVRDIRQATKVEEAKTGSIVFLATIGGKAWKVKYECGVSQSGTTFTQCERLAAEEGKALPATGPLLVRDMVNGSEVFSYLPNTTEPKIVTAKIELPAKGTLKQAGSTGYGHKVVLEDAAFMRNLYLEG